ncbi:syncytin-1-like isoform X2 [Rhinopithecus roxellana]|uniref:syncytin-1-like isoform X2 n=1 Tax=Rhinopithecus roxellana TaxID=61622 RepID=UPI0012375765|nr:syncytin-1-like isoform X2 [Rhinopithecus roxellana]
MNSNYRPLWTLVMTCQVFQVHAGFGDPREALTHIQQRHAYLPSDSLKWRCVSTPRISDGGGVTTCPCDTFKATMHSSCYTTYQECTSDNKTYYTAILTRTRNPTIGASNVPTVLGNTNNLVSAGCTGIVGKPVCWNIHPPLHISDGGGPQDKVREIRVYKKLEELQKSLYPEIRYHPLALPKIRGKEKIDAQTFDLLTATHNLLNNSNSSLANDCWLCLPLGDPIPLAITSNDLNYTSNASCTIIPPLQVQPLEFSNSPCFYSPFLNNTYDIDVGIVEFNNCSITTNISQSLCAPNSSVFICGNNRAYTYLPVNWTGRCVLATLLPDIDIIPGDEPVPIPAIDHFLGRAKRAIQFIPLLVGLGITTAVTTGVSSLGGLCYSIHQIVSPIDLRYAGHLKYYTGSTRSSRFAGRSSAPK